MGSLFPNTLVHLPTVRRDPGSKEFIQKDAAGKAGGVLYLLGSALFLFGAYSTRALVHEIHRRRSPLSRIRALSDVFFFDVGQGLLDGPGREVQILFGVPVTDIAVMVRVQKDPSANKLGVKIIPFGPVGFGLIRPEGDEKHGGHPAQLGAHVVAFQDRPGFSYKNGLPFSQIWSRTRSRSRISMVFSAATNPSLLGKKVEEMKSFWAEAIITSRFPVTTLMA